MGAKRKRKEQARVVSKRGNSKHDVPPPVVSLVSPSADDESDRDIKEVMAILMAQGLGEALDEERARSLVEQTKGEYESVEARAEACLVALACDNEIDNEATDVAIAMADSLRQAEAAQTSTSLENEPPAVLLEHFKNKARSQVAAYLIDRSRSELLEHRELYDLLDLEAGCAKWYPGSRSYFRELLDGLRQANEDQARMKLRESLDLIRCVII